MLCRPDSIVVLPISFFTLAVAGIPEARLGRPMGNGVGQDGRLACCGLSKTVLENLQPYWVARIIVSLKVNRDRVFIMATKMNLRWQAGRI